MPNFFRPLILLAAMTTAFVAQAAAPMVRTQVPGYYRTMLGDDEITALSDGSLDLPMDKLMTQPQEITRAELARQFMKTPTEVAVNSYLVNTGSKLILIDTGTGGLMGKTSGTLLANLRAAGYQPDQVDEVLITHMHVDHMNGLTSNGQAVFPNATVRAGKADIDYWLDQATMDKAPAASKYRFEAARKAFAPYQASNRLLPIDGDVEILPGIRSLATPGHSPGHMAFVVESRGQRMVVLGDLVHMAPTQFEHPQVGVTFDGDNALAAASRVKVFEMVAKDGSLVAVSHLPFPGLGHVVSAGDHWEFVPQSFSSRLP